MKRVEEIYNTLFYLRRDLIFYLKRDPNKKQTMNIYFEIEGHSYIVGYKGDTVLTTNKVVKKAEFIYNNVADLEVYEITNKFEIRFVIEQLDIKLVEFIDFIKYIPLDYISGGTINNIIEILNVKNETFWKNVTNKTDVEKHFFISRSFKLDEVKNIPNVEDYTGMYPGSDTAAQWKRYFYAKQLGKALPEPERKIREKKEKRRAKKNKFRNGKEILSKNKNTATKREEDSQPSSSKKVNKTNPDDSSSESENTSKPSSTSKLADISLTDVKKFMFLGKDNSSSSNEVVASFEPVLDVEPAINYKEFMANETNYGSVKTIHYSEKREVELSFDNIASTSNILLEKKMINIHLKFLRMLAINHLYHDDLVKVVNLLPHSYIEENMDEINAYLYYAFLVLNKETINNKNTINKSSRSVFNLKDIENLYNFSKIDLPNRCFIPFADLKTDNIIMRCVDWNLANTKQFKMRFNTFTRGVFEGFEFKSKNMNFNGSCLFASLGISPLESKFSTLENYFASVFFDSDIDIAYCGDNDKDFETYAVELFNHVKQKVPEAKLNIVKKAYDIKYEIDMGFKIIDFYKSNFNMVANVAKFHFNCVRAVYDGSDVYVLSDAVGAFKTGININFRIFFNNINPMDIILKYVNKGQSFILNTSERYAIVKYINNSEWKDAFKSIKPEVATTSIATGALNFMNNILSNLRKETVEDNDLNCLIKSKNIFGNFTPYHEFYNFRFKISKDQYPKKDYFTRQPSVNLVHPEYVNHNIKEEDNVNVPYHHPYSTKFVKFDGNKFVFSL